MREVLWKVSCDVGDRLQALEQTCPVQILASSHTSSVTPCPHMLRLIPTFWDGPGVALTVSTCPIEDSGHLAQIFLLQTHQAACPLALSFLDRSKSGRGYANQGPVKGLNLVAQWLRIHLAMQQTVVWSLVWEDFPMLQGNWAHVSQLLSLHSRAFELQLLSPSTLETMFRNKRSHCKEKTAHCS